jgi:hypothetical protein
MTLDVSASYIKQNDKNLMAQGEYFNPLITLYFFPRGENFDDIRMYERFRRRPPDFRSALALGQRTESLLDCIPQPAQ